MKPLYYANMVINIWKLEKENAELREQNADLLKQLDRYTEIMLTPIDDGEKYETGCDW